MSEDNIKIMQSLGLNYKPAIDSTMALQKTIGDLNKQLEILKSNALKGANDVNNAFSSQLGNAKVKDMFNQIHKENKPIEIKVVTDKAEIAMQKFAESMGIKLDKSLREQFQGLAGSMSEGFDEKQFAHLGERVGVAFGESMKKEHKRMSKEAIADTEEAYRYLLDYFKGGNAINLGLGSTQQVITEVDGFKEAMRGIAPIANDGKVSLDNLKTDMQQLGAFASQNIDSYEGFATALTKVVQEYRQFKATGTIDSVDPTQMMGMDINQFVETELMKLTTELGKIQYEAKATKESLRTMTPTGIQEAHAEALKLNKVFDQTIAKNTQLAKNTAWKQQFQGISDSSDELKKMNKHYSELEVYGKANIKTIRESNLERMKAQASTIQQKVENKSLNAEYGVQAQSLREQLSLIQSRLQTEGKLTAEEVAQTQELKEQLDILRGQVTVAEQDSKRNKTSNEPVPDNEFSQKSSWFTDGAKFYAVSRAAKEATSTIKDVEMGMVEVSRVMTDTSFVFDEYRDNLFQLGIDYGQTFDNVQSVALRWAQSGYNVADSLTLTETSLLALNTAELDATNATESMIGIMAQWGLEADELALVMDKVNITADTYAVTSQDLVDGLLRSSGAAKIMGMSLDDTIATLTVLRETTGRTGKEVGNALSSILSYIQRPKSIDVMESLGIRMFADEAKTEFRNVMEVFDELSHKWKDPSVSNGAKDALMAGAQEAGLFAEELANVADMQEEYAEMTKLASEAQGEFTDIEKRDAAQAAAGVYRRNYFIGLLEKFSTTQEVLNGLVDAGGYSLSENAKTMEALEKKSQSLETSIDALAVAMGDAGLNDVLKDLADLGVGAVNSFNKLDDDSKKLILTFATVFTALKTVQWGAKTFGIELGGISKVVSGVITSLTGLTVSTNVLLIAIAGLTAAGLYLYNYQKKQEEQKAKAIETSSQAVQSYQDEISTLSQLSNEYDSIAGKTDSTAEEKERLIGIQKELANTFPELTTGFDEEGNAMALNADATRNLIDAKKDLLDQELLALSKLAEGRLPELQSSIKETEDRITELNEKLRTGDTNETVWKSRKDGIMEVKDMTEKYAQEVVELSAKLREEQSELSNVEKAIKQQKDAHVILNGTLEEAREQLGMLTDAELVELGVVKDLSDTAIRASIARLNEDRSHTNAMVEMTKTRIGAMQSEMNALAMFTGGKVGDANPMHRMHSQADLDSASLTDRIFMESENKAIKAGRELLKLESNIKNIDKALANINNLGVPSGGGSGGGEDPKKGSGGSSAKSTAYENKALAESLKLLEHRKKISEESQASIRQELEELHKINSLHVKTADERMSMSEKIYATEKRLRDRTLQDSVNWINQKKSFDELSVQEEIEAWERVRKNQVGNVEAVKQATLNLYKLRDQLRNENLKQEESTISHLTKLGVMGIQDQINAYRELYKVKADSLDDERARIENLFGLYKSLLKDQERDLKDSHTSNIKQIEEASKARVEAIERESKLRQDAQNDIIKGIEKELELLNAQEEEYDHDKKMAELYEQLAYWEVRTSEDARKKVIDIKKQIDEANHKREVDLQKKALNEKKKNAEDEIRNEEDKTRKKIEEVEESTRKEVELAEKAYEDIEIAFDEHSIDMIALASSMSKDMFEEFQKNYLDPLQKALKENDYNSVNSIMGGVNDFAQGAYDKTYNSTNAQVNRLANQILSLKNQYEYQNDKSASKRADSIYDELSKLKPSVANDLHKMDYKTAQEYVRNLPKMHQGGKSLSYGAVEMMPGELVFPPDLSIKLEGLIGALYQRPISTNSNSSTDNRRQVNIENLVRVENMRMEDEVDERSFSREIERQLSSIV